MIGVLSNIKTFLKLVVVLAVVGGAWYAYDAFTLSGDERRVEMVVTWEESRAAGMSAHFHFPVVNWWMVERDSPITQLHEASVPGQRLEIDAQAFDESNGRKSNGEPLVKPAARHVAISINVVVHSADGSYQLVMLCTEPARSRKVCVGVIK